MDSMPNEILELIFAHIPMTDLFKVHSLVCKNWKNVISRELYMPWKKSYYRYKLICRRDMNNLEGECFTKLKAAISQNFPELKSVYLAIPIECFREIAEKLPTTKAEMLEIDQMTHFRFDRFGTHLLEVCKDFKALNLSKIKSEKPPAKNSTGGRSSLSLEHFSISLVSMHFGLSGLGVVHWWGSGWKTLIFSQVMMDSLAPPGMTQLDLRETVTR